MRLCLQAAVEGFVQINKHGGVYTSGNRERYPFGMRSQGNTGSRISGFTTYGYTDYEWLYGYYKADMTRTGLFLPGPPCGSPHMGVTINGYRWFYGMGQDRTARANELPGLNEHGYVNPTTSHKCINEQRDDAPYDLDGESTYPCRAGQIRNHSPSGAPMPFASSGLRSLLYCAGSQRTILAFIVHWGFLLINVSRSAEPEQMSVGCIQTWRTARRSRLRWWTTTTTGWPMSTRPSANRASQRRTAA